MHSNVAVLTKMQLVGLFGINRMLHAGSTQERKRTGLLALALIGGVFAAGVLSALTSYSMTVAGFANALPAIVLMICTMLVLMLTFLKSSGVLAGGHDYDLVMSLPVSPTQVVFSRVIPVYLTNVLFCGIVMVPAALVLSAQGGATFFGTGLLVLTAFVVPLFPMTLALTAGTLVALAFGTRETEQCALFGSQYVARAGTGCGGCWVQPYQWRRTYHRRKRFSEQLCCLMATG